MDLLRYVSERVPIEPWVQGSNIPWNDPGFSERMLAEHLDDTHDMASRRRSLVAEHVAWIHREVLGERPSRVLDLACGPGLYLNALAALGHRGVGIDFSPAAVRYARDRAAEQGLQTSYIEADVRDIAFGSDFDVAMMIFGQINVFRREEAISILRRAHQALSPHGVLILEPHRPETVMAIGDSPPTWESNASGLFSPRPHVLLVESAWDEEASTATQRFSVVDAESADVEIHALSTVAYGTDEMADVLAGAGFTDVCFHESLSGRPAEGLGTGLCVVTARAGVPGPAPSPR